MSKEPADVPPPKQKFSLYFYNWTTYIGVLIAIFFFIVELLMFAFEFFSHGQNLYLGILTYAILPVFLILGLILIPVGAFMKRRSVRKGKSAAKPGPIKIDPSIPSHRNAIFVFVLGTGILLIMTAIGTYKAYQYTESVAFCGLMCHDVMKPEHTTYINSPHARVKCVECHIGEGAEWYVRAKISGIRQVYHTIKGDYSRPIATPVHNLRPAEETCERCHWPGKSYTSVEMNKTYFTAYESEHPRWLLRMLVHVGSTPDKGGGIHKHMYIDNDIYFAAEDERLQKVTWVKSVDKDGKETVYVSEDSKWKDTPPPAEIIHKMDCMDCHNRPTHRYPYPSRLLNQAMASNQIDPELPGIKSKAMELLSKEYRNEKEALETIGTELTAHYREELGDDFAAREPQVKKAVATVQKMFQNSMFPEMKARWDAYPDNIGHLVAPGCFRCHDGEHTSSDGAVITKDCTVCHSIIEQGPPNNLERDTRGLGFTHPFEDDGLWEDMSCTDCHTGN
ncbi:MAG: NapC/NirT family cytochrome c [Candidatus Omnitrophica bacterium]|nr:NapC/NirT family cytochrome c [Candidatus Omnitrophota bacterium]MCB9721962.1 NapC/NirT family cytochrome c [Candidatus Omnitrophota bacterium]